MCNIPPIFRQYNVRMKPTRSSRPAHPSADIALVVARIAMLATILTPLTASAAGFGEITLHSRIGENLLAEVPLLGASKEIADAGCYTLAPLPGADLPVITQARIRIIKSDGNYRLLIVGNKPIAEPVFTIRLHAGCGIDLQHDYTLMPEAPEPVAKFVAPSAPGHDARQNAIGQGEAAPPQRPENPPDKKGGKRQMAEASQPRPPRPSHAEAPAPRRERKPLSQPARPLPAGDRLVLATAPAEIAPGQRSDIGQLEDRLLKMESSLHLLNQEIDTLNTSLTLATEMQSAQHELQTAQTLQQPAIPTTITTPPGVPERHASSGNWLELLLGTLVGGSLAAGVAAFLSRREKSSTSRRA